MKNFYLRYKVIIVLCIISLLSSQLSFAFDNSITILKSIDCLQDNNGVPISGKINKSQNAQYFNKYLYLEKDSLFYGKLYSNESGCYVIWDYLTFANLSSDYGIKSSKGVYRSDFVIKSKINSGDVVSFKNIVTKVGKNK